MHFCKDCLLFIKAASACVHSTIGWEKTLETLLGTLINCVFELELLSILFYVIQWKKYKIIQLIISGTFWNLRFGGELCKKFTKEKICIFIFLKHNLLSLTHYPFLLYNNRMIFFYMVWCVYLTC